MPSLGLRCGFALGNAAVQSKRQTRRALLSVAAATSTSGANAESISAVVSRNETVRILRYPDGHERRIIYPAVTTPEVEVDIEDSWSMWTQVEEVQPLRCWKRLEATRRSLR